MRKSQLQKDLAGARADLDTCEKRLVEARARASDAAQERDQLRAVVEHRPMSVATVDLEQIIEEAQPPTVDCTSAFITSDGKFKCAGALGALPWNPHAGAEWPIFRVNLNGVWREVKMLDASEVYGWVAEGVDSIEAARQISPKVELRKQG